MKHKSEKPIYNYKNKISLIFFLVLIAWFVYTGAKKTKTNNDLYKKGEIAKAVVIDKRKVGGKGIERVSYSFSFNGQRYEGWVDDDYYEVGDTIQILFLKENPEINEGKKFLDRINE